LKRHLVCRTSLRPLRPDQKRHHVTIALRRWSVAMSFSRACVGRVAMHVSEDYAHDIDRSPLCGCHMRLVVCSSVADDTDARTSHRVALSTSISNVQYGIETQKYCTCENRLSREEENHLKVLPSRSEVGTYEETILIVDGETHISMI
ncbi:hypothetical protein KCU69_g16, partial [Aureobasidium melanogenum]